MIWIVSTHCRTVAMVVSLAMGLPSTSVGTQTCAACSGQASPVCPITWENGFQAVQNIVGGCAVSVASAWSDGWKTETCDVSVPEGTVLVDVLFTEQSNNNGDYTVLQYTSGHIKYSQAVDEAYISLYKTAIEIDGDYAASIKQYRDRHLKIAEGYDSNVDTVRLSVRAKGSGNFWDQRHGWEVAKVDLRVVCIAPANLTEQLTKLLGFDKYAQKSQQYVSIYNDTGGPVYGLAQPLPVGKTTCAAASGVSSEFEVDDKQQRSFQVNHDSTELKNEAMCIVLGRINPPGYSDFSKACMVKTASLTNLSDSSLSRCYMN